MPESAEKRLERKLAKVYAEAQKDMQEKLDEYIAKFRKEDAQKRQDVAAGIITQSEYDEWRKGAIFQGKMWRAKVKQITDSLADANTQSLRLIRGEQLNTFAEGLNHEQYVLEQNTGLSVNFGVYDADTVSRLVRDEPDLLPKKTLNRTKDSRWNHKKVTSAVLQGIIQGESIDDIAKRIALATSQQNRKAMIRYARTATTGAQNAGRMETMHRAQGMGINVRKKWMATLDARTRDSHQHMDGKTVDVDDKFPNGLMYPGDPSGPAAEVYNCRCTLVYVYPDYPTSPGERLDNITGEHVRGDMTYAEWAGTQPKAQPEKKPEEKRKKPGEKLAGVEQGEPMTHEQADTGRVNPNYGTKTAYNINCQSCVVAYEARLRGYDIEVVPNDAAHPMCKRLSRDTRLAWKDRQTGETPDFMFPYRPTLSSKWQGDPPTPKRFRQMLEESVQEGGRYHLGFGWKGSRRSGHIVTMGKRNNELYIYDPQSDRTYTGKAFDLYLARLKMQTTSYGYKYYQWPEVLRVDDKDIDYDVAGQVVRSREK